MVFNSNSLSHCLAENVLRDMRSANACGDVTYYAAGGAFHAEARIALHNGCEVYISDRTDGTADVTVFPEGIEKVFTVTDDTGDDLSRVVWLVHSLSKRSATAA